MRQSKETATHKQRLYAAQRKASIAKAERAALDALMTWAAAAPFMRDAREIALQNAAVALAALRGGQK